MKSKAKSCQQKHQTTMQQYSQPTGDRIPKHWGQDSQAPGTGFPTGWEPPSEQTGRIHLTDILKTGQAASLAVKISGTVLSESRSSTYQDSAN